MTNMIYDICSAYIPKYSYFFLSFIISCYKQMEINTGAVSSVGRASRLHPAKPAWSKC